MAVYNRAILGASENVNLNANAFDLMAEAYQIDQSLFEAVIEVDFAEAFNEAGIISLNEEEQAAAKEAQKEGILKKAWEVLQKIGKAIEQIFDSIISFISNLIANDAKIKEKYGKYFTNISDFKDCDLKGKYVDFDYVEKMRRTFDGKLSAAGVSDQVNYVNTDTKVELDKVVLDSGEKTIYECFAANNANFSKMVDYVQGGYKTILDEVKTKKKKAIDSCKRLEATLKAAKKEKADGANEAYKDAIKATTSIKVAASSYKSMVVSATAHARSCYLKLAKWAVGKAGNASEAKQEAPKEEPVKAEAVNMLIELESNLFIEQMANLV